MKNKKSVLIIGPFPEPITGVSLANEVLCKYLVARGYKVNVINTSLQSFEENVGSFSLKKVFYFLKFNKYIFKIFKTDIVYLTPGHTFFGVVKYAFFFLFSFFLNKKCIIHIHSNTLKYEYKKSSFFKKAIIKFLLSLSSEGIVLSPSLIDNLIPFLPQNNITVVRNFVEPEFFSETKKNRDILRIIFLSNLMTQKGIFFLLEALEVLEKKKILFEVKLAGYIDAKVEKHIKTKISKINNVEYIGVVHGFVKKELLMWGNVFVFPSYLSEGLPISILEAMANKNRIISTEHPSLKDFFEDSAILYIQKQSTNAIVKSLILVNSESEDDITQIVNRTYKEISNKFTVHSFVTSIENLMFK